mgnify:CR=1 FL=1
MLLDSKKLNSFLDKHGACHGTFKITNKGNTVKVRCMTCNDVENITAREPLEFSDD